VLALPELAQGQMENAYAYNDLISVQSCPWACAPEAHVGMMSPPFCNGVSIT